MFADVVNYDYLLVTAERTRDNLAKVIEGRGLRELRDDRVLAYAAAADIEDEPPAYAAAADIEGGLLAEFSAEQIQEVIDELDRACDELSSERDRESEWKWMCIPSISILAILQSELTTAFEQLPWAFARLDEDNVDGRIAQTPDQIRVTHIWGPYEVTDPPIFGDPRWLWMGVVKLWYKLKDDKVDFGGLPTQPVTIANEARIVLVGDWGSGHKRAKKVAREIRKILKKGLDEGKEQYVIHLGDVYFSGSRKEYEKNFLRYWPVKHGEDIGSFIICGNHDMYRGGHAYYGTALADSRFAQQDRKSVFALRNDNWQFLGLDTAYENKQISNGQVQWIEGQLNSAPNHRTTMLSHHPLWSAYRHTGQELCKQIGHILATGDVDAWFWGHEHRCLVYKPRDGVQFTSCVGHGGIPSYLIAASGDPYLKYEYRKRHISRASPVNRWSSAVRRILRCALRLAGHGFEPWNTFGFAVIDLDGRAMHVRYIDESGTTHHDEHL